MGKKRLSHRLLQNMAFYFGVIALFLFYIFANMDVFAEGLDVPKAGETPLVAYGYPILIEEGIVKNITTTNRPAPTGITSTDETGFQKNDGTISGLDDTMEISKNSVSWTSLKGKLKDGILTDLEPRTYYIRYAETDEYAASAYIYIKINAVPESHTLTIKDYEGKRVLYTITAQKSDGPYGFCEVYLPDKYRDNVFFSKAKGTEVDRYTEIGITNEKKMKITLPDDLVLYALEPTVTDYMKEFDFSDGKTKTFVTDNDSISEMYEAEDEDLIIKYYLSLLFTSKIYNDDFGDIDNISKEEADKFFESNTFYITPCAVNDKRLTDTELTATNEYFSGAKVIPHISLKKENDSVLKLKVKMLEKDGKSAVQYTLAAVENVKDTKKTIFEIEGFPKEDYWTLLVINPIKNIRYKKCIFNAVFAQEEKTEKNEQKDDATEVKPSDDKTDDITKTISYAENVPVSKKSKIIMKTNTDKKDVAGSTQKYLQLRQAKITKSSIKIKWKKIKKADGYIIYGSKCGSKMKVIRNIKKASTTNITIKKLKKNTYYKYLVVAYKNTASGPKVITTSKSMHIATSGGKNGNPTGIKVKKSKVTLKKGKTSKIKATLSKKKKVHTHIAKFRYESLNPKVATVDKKGRIKGIKKGKTTILVYTQNGICKKVKITVK